MELLAISETGLNKTTVKSRLQQRDIKPEKYIGPAGFYKEEALEAILKPLPRGSRSPKYKRTWTTKQVVQS